VFYQCQQYCSRQWVFTIQSAFTLRISNIFNVFD
jgi:hypothetical protein